MADLFHEDIFFKFLGAVLAIFNPLYNIPVFLSMTRDCTEGERRRVALIVMVSVTVIALLALLSGEEVLSIFGIGIPAFRIAGGIVIFGIAMAMLNAEERPPGDRSAVADGHKRKLNFAVVPLAIPLTIGPGTIAVTIVFTHELSDAAEIVTLAPAVLIACAIVGLGLFFAEPISRLMGETMINVVTRIMAILLVAVAIEMVITGAFDAIDERFPGLSGGAGNAG